MVYYLIFLRNVKVNVWRFVIVDAFGILWRMHEQDVVSDSGMAMQTEMYRSWRLAT